jgi:hypothetical protein
MVMEGEIIIFEKLAPVAESPGESSPPTSAAATTHYRIACDAATSLLTVDYAATFCRKIINAARCGSFVYIQ